MIAFDTVNKVRRRAASPLTRGAAVRFRSYIASGVALIAGAPFGAMGHAQTPAIDTARVHRDLAVLRGRVARRDGESVPAADVWLVTLDAHVSADSNGAFTVIGIPPGTQLVQVRRVGYTAARQTVVLRAGEDTTATFVLTELATTLDTVHTTAPQHHYLSPAVRAFEERRTSGMGGHFISDSVLRANESRSLANIVASRLPGATVVPGLRGSSVLISTRKQCRGLTMHMCTTPNCYVTVFLDGVEIFYPAMMDESPPQPPPDLARFPVSDLAGVEFYASSAAAPVGMQSTRSEGCGTLWLWTREK